MEGLAGLSCLADIHQEPFEKQKRKMIFSLEAGPLGQHLAGDSSSWQCLPGFGIEYGRRCLACSMPADFLKRESLRGPAQQLHAWMGLTSFGCVIAGIHEG